MATPNNSMHANSNRIFRSGAFGLVIAGLFLRYQMITGLQSPVSRNPALMLMFIVLCPPSLLSIAFDAEVGTNDFYVLWAIIGLLNAGLWATIKRLAIKRAQRRSS